MLQNLTARVLIGGVVGVGLWFLLGRLLGPGTNLEVTLYLIVSMGAVTLAPDVDDCAAAAPDGRAA